MEEENLDILPEGEAPADIQEQLDEPQEEIPRERGGDILDELTGTRQRIYGGEAKYGKFDQLVRDGKLKEAAEERRRLEELEEETNPETGWPNRYTQGQTLESHIQEVGPSLIGSELLNKVWTNFPGEDLLPQTSEVQEADPSLIGSGLLDRAEEFGGAILTRLQEAAEDDPTTYRDELIRGGFGVLQGLANVVGLPVIKQALQLAGLPAWIVGKGLGAGLEKAGVDPRYGQIIGEVGEIFIPGYGAVKLAGKLKKAGFGTKLIDNLADQAGNYAYAFGYGMGGTGGAFSTGGKAIRRSALPKNSEFHQLVLKMDQEVPYELTPPGKFVSKVDDAIPDSSSKLDKLTYQEIQALGPAVKSYERKRAFKDAASPAGMEKMQIEVNSTFEQLLGPDFDQDLVRGYMKAVADHEGALTELQRIMNDKTGKLWDKQHSKALRHVEHSGRMLGNKGLFPAFNFPDVLDQTPLGRSKKKIIREGNRPDIKARGSDFQKTLARVLGKPLSLEESILYWYDQDMFYFWKELSPLQRQQLVDSSRTISGGRIKSELTVAENINQALESMRFGTETMSGKLGRKLTSEERLEALVSEAQAALLKKRKYKGRNLKTSPRQGNVFYDIKSGIETDYRPDLSGKGAYWDIDSDFNIN